MGSGFRRLAETQPCILPPPYTRRTPGSRLPPLFVSSRLPPFILSSPPPCPSPSFPDSLPPSLRACSSLLPALTHFLLKAAGFSLASLSSSIWTCQISRSRPCLVCRTCWQVVLRTEGREERVTPGQGCPAPEAPLRGRAQRGHPRPTRAQPRWK